MKYVLMFTPQEGGSEEERYEAARRAQQLLQKFTPAKSATIHQWVTRIDGQGGFSVVETDNEEDLLRDLTLWSSFVEFRCYPVIDIDRATPIVDAALRVRESLPA